MTEVPLILNRAVGLALAFVVTGLCSLPQAVVDIWDCPKPRRSTFHYNSRLGE